MSSSESGRRTFQSRLNDMVDQLRDGIHTGIYKTGTYLPPEKNLAKQFGLSNKTVRKGLEELAEEGLIEKIPRVGSLVIASGREPSGKPEITLMLGCYLKDELELGLSRLLADFEQLHPEIHVEAVAVNSYPTFVKTMRPMMDNGLVDLITIKDRHFEEVAGEGCEDILKPQQPSGDVYPFLNKVFTERSVLYALPIQFSPLILAYNLRHFREAGVQEPDSGWTWEHAMAQAGRLSIPGQRYGFHFQPLHHERWPLFLLQGNGSSAAGTRSGAWLDGIRLSKEMMGNHTYFPNLLFSSENDVGTLFLQGKTSMIITGYEALNRFSSSPLEYDISSLPYMHDPRTLLSSTGIAVNALTKYPEEAQLLADYLTSPRAQRLIREHTLSIPALKASAEAPDEGERTLNRPSRFHLFRDIIPAFRTYRDLELSAPAFRELHETLKTYWTGLIGEDTLRAEIDAITSRYPARPETQQAAIPK